MPTHAVNAQQILIVDDSPPNLAVYEHILRQLDDVEIAKFSSSAMALAWAGANETDLVIVDYRMPTPNGIEFIETFRKGNIETPIVMITGSQENAVRHQALEVGADDFLQKPADPIEFLTRARNLLKLRERGKKLEGRAAWLEQEIRRATAEVKARERETIFRLTRAVEHRDNETKNHIVRIGYYSRMLARLLGLPKDVQELYLTAAPMHDLGKVAVPDNILLKQGALTAPEWEIMKTHARAGYEILQDSASPLIELAAEIALSHHEKFDGSGYPRALRGSDIPLSGRICAVADVFDALLSARPYKDPWPLSAVIEKLAAGRGTHFDPHVVDAFLANMPEVHAIQKEFDDAVAA